MNQSRGVCIAHRLSLLALLAACLPLLTTGATTAAASEQTSTYVFVAEESTLLQTGGIAGVHRTYTVEGRFQLSIDPNAGTATFARVDANAVDPGDLLAALDPNEVFNLTALTGMLTASGACIFDGRTRDGSSSRVTLTLSDSLVHVSGETMPPPGSADFFIFSIDAVAQRKYSGGTGEPNDPYQIATAADLIALGETPEDYDKHFLLTADIDLDPNLPGRKVFDKAVIAPDIDSVTSGFQGTAFTGVFDGNGHTISHLTIEGESWLGLFGRLGAPASLSNLGLEAVEITGTWHVGGLVGSNGDGSIANCHSSGSVSGNNPVGGLVGYNDSGVVRNCYSTSSVSGTGGIGGLVGQNYFGTISNCYSTGSVSGTSPVGGLVGWNIGALIYCYSTGFVSGTGSGVGGLVGGHRSLYAFGGACSCFWDIQTSGQTTSADGTGKTTNEMQSAQTFQAWGILHSEGIWTIDEGKDYPRLRWEDDAGASVPLLSDLLQGVGTADHPFLIYTPEELNLIGLFVCEWDKHFKLMADIDLSGFDGQDGRPAFNMIAPCVLDPHTHLWGIPFTGVFDGNAHEIQHLTVRISDGGCGGLIGGLCGEVKNLGVVDVNVSGSVEYWGAGGIGALVGYNCSSWEYGIGWEYRIGVVTRCYSTGVVSGDHCVGGLVGINSGDVLESYSTATVTGFDSDIGGLVGSNMGTVNRCYSMGTVAGNSYVDGLLGSNSRNLGGGTSASGDIANCYSTGAVSGNEDIGGLVGGYSGSTTSSFWDTQTSGQAASAGGTGKTTVEMQTAATFLDAGWDFVGETANGTEDIWKIAEGLDYPRLWWEPYDGQVTVVLGQVFTVTLESNPSTGYRWEWVDHQDSIVEQMGEAQFKPRETGDPPLVGAGGWESFDFMAVHPGQMTLKLVYRRPWEEGVEPLKTFSLQVTVP